MTAQGKKRGRPPFKWHGLPGKEFVTTIRLAWWQRRPKSIAHVVYVVVRRQHKFPDLEKHSDHYLRKQFGKAEEFWCPYRKLYKAYKASKAFPQFPQP
jgi:hypothetical protein